MNDARLLQSQKNEVLLTIKESGLNPREFELVDPPENGCITHLIHVPSGYRFRLSEFAVSYSPAEETRQQHIEQSNWAGKISILAKWLDYLKREVEAPDLWASLAQAQEMLGAEPTEAVNTPFSAEEQIQAKRAIEDIRIYISATYSLADEPLAQVNRKLDYLIDASTRVGRKDWKVLFLGILFTLVVEQLIPSGPGLRELFGIAGHLIHQLLGGGMSPPLPH